jgi:hypothetical protein
MSAEVKTAVRFAQSHRLLFTALVTGFLTFDFDFIFHQSFTFPMEVPLYFLMKFTSSFGIAYFLVPKLGIVKSALLFTFWVDVYYAVFVVLLMVPGLSSSPSQVIPILGNTNQLILLPAWTLVHGLFFWLAAVVASHLAVKL